MGIGSVWPWLIVLAIVILLFGRGRVSSLMGDVASGVKSFKKGLADDERPAGQSRLIEQSAAEPVASTADEKRTAG